MNVSHPIQCKHLKPEDCIHFNPYCIKTEKGTCQRSKDGLDLPREKVLAYLEEKRKEEKISGKIIEQKHIKRGGIKVSGEMTSIHEFKSILTVSQNVSQAVKNETIVLKFFIGEQTILDLSSYIKTMTEENLVMDQKMHDYSGNSRFNSVNSHQVEHNVLQIHWIETNKEFKGNRFGMYAMYLVEQYAKKYNNIKYITLEDHANVDPPNNIYYKLNFNLLAWGQNSDGSYEMWKNWHDWAAEHGMDNVQGDDRMISMESFEANHEIGLVKEEFQIQR